MKKIIVENENIKVYILALVSILIVRFALEIITFENKLTISTLFFLTIFLVVNKKYLEKS
ncbi:MAG: hypothetical protein CBC28_01895 [Flavobacteriaceae bacterium TMED68]|nr:MAG: hypothetical protein CBC28_01895 [Flavobacteriaceae bacterium TMED68]|tara:strand:+ start:45212 stop:45391 length:180 start_codon:yes stop_codon:yes gene_type:complete